MHPFTVEFRYRRDGGAHLIEVHGTTSPYSPAITTGPADNWVPTEGGELEDLEVFIQRGAGRRRLPPALETTLREDEYFLARIHRALDCDD